MAFELRKELKEKNMNIPVFPDGARVVFAGDSITHGNKYVALINEYYRANLKDRKVQFFNCGPVFWISLFMVLAVLVGITIFWKVSAIVKINPARIIQQE